MARILIVDDSTMARKFNHYLLTSLGYEADEAEDGYIALEKLLTRDYDLVITDINMPRMDGFNFISEVRQLHSYKNTPIIIVTTQELPSDIDRGITLGANLYFVKPTDVENLVSCIRRLVGQKLGTEA